MQVYPNQSSPGENFDVFYFLRNPTDNNTYFVQAVIYDGRTGAVLKTVKLTQTSTNSRLFTKTVQAPADSSGYGRNIISIATVYTDAGYTTKSTDYEEQEQYYLVKAVLPVVGSGGGIDYQHLRDMMEESIGKAIRPLSTKAEPAEPSDPSASANIQFPDMPFEGVFGAIGALQREVNRIPKDAADLSGITDALARLHSLVESQPDPDTVDLGPVEEAINSVAYDVAQLSDRMDQFETGIRDHIETTLRSLFDGLGKALNDSLTQTIESQQLSIPVFKTVDRKSTGGAARPAVDITHLM